MSFEDKSNAAANPVASIGRTGAQRPFEQASAFINLYLPVRNADGSTSRRKVGFVALKNSKKMDRAMINLLSQDGGVESFLTGLEIDFNMAESEDSEISFAI